jgi:hypothetical protein
MPRYRRRIYKRSRKTRDNTTEDSLSLFSDPNCRSRESKERREDKCVESSNKCNTTGDNPNSRFVESNSANSDRNNDAKKHSHKFAKDFDWLELFVAKDFDWLEFFESDVLNEPTICPVCKKNMRVIERYRKEDGTVIDVVGCNTKGCKYEEYK